MTDQEIKHNVLEGNQETFKQIVDDNQSIVLNTCFRFVNNREDAEDITQDVFVEVFRSISKFRGDSKLSTWIYRIAVTKSLDHLKSKKTKKRFGILKNMFGENDEMKEQLPTSESLQPDKLAENEDRIKILNWALDSLAENQRVAFTLCKYDQMSYNEISQILDTSVSSVESLIFRAKKNLKKKLSKYYEKHL